MTLDDFIIVSEVDQGPAFAGALFERKYQAPAPTFAHHVVAFWKRADDCFVPASYVHFTDCGDIALVGGACTDGAVLKNMHPDQRAALDEYGGLMLATLRYGILRYGARCEAVFTCCGDARALETTPKVGFVETGVRHLLVNWQATTEPKRRHELCNKAKSCMPF